MLANYPKESVMNIWSRRPLPLLTALLVAGLPGGAAGEAPTPGINETVTFFYYEDLEAALRFYEDVLELPVTMNEDWVKILRVTATSSVGLVLDGHGFHDVAADKPAMLSIVTEDVDAWYRRLLDAGVAIRRELPPPDDAANAGKAPIRGFIAEDPGGYTVEFFSWQTAPGS